MVTATQPRPVGDLLRDWRRRRRLSQLELAAEAGVSTRHLSFVETGRSRPSRGMILRLADRLEVPLRERNDLLSAAGHAPFYGRRPLGAPELGPVRHALNKALDGHEPYPAMVVDRAWNLVMANDAAMLFLEDVADELVRPPVNLHRLALHPRGLAARTVNLPEVRAHLVARMARQVSRTGDPELVALHEETSAYGYPDPDSARGDSARENSARGDSGSVDPASADSAAIGGSRTGGSRTGGSDTVRAGNAGATATEVALRTRLRHGDAVLSFVRTVTAFDAPADVTVAELAIEAYFPADDETARALRERARATA